MNLQSVVINALEIVNNPAHKYQDNEKFRLILDLAFYLKSRALGSFSCEEDVEIDYDSLRTLSDLTMKLETLGMYLFNNARNVKSISFDHDRNYSHIESLKDSEKHFALVIHIEGQEYPELVLSYCSSEELFSRHHDLKAYWEKEQEIFSNIIARLPHLKNDLGYTNPTTSSDEIFEYLKAKKEEQTDQACLIN